MIRNLTVTFLALGCLAGQARADLIIASAPLVVANPGDSGWFDIDVVYVPNASGPAPTYSVAGFTVNVSIAAPGIVFTGADESTSAPYLLDFPGSTNGGLTIVDPDPIPPDGSTYLTFYDSTAPPDFPGRTMNEGDVYGLARIYYSVALDANPGAYAITLDQPAPDGLCDLTSSNGDSIIGGVSSGILQVVPEPPSLVGTTIFGFAAAIISLRRRRAAARMSQ
jgi:hypothetical protein